MRLCLGMALLLSVIGIIAVVSSVCVLGVRLIANRKATTALAACLIGALPSLGFVVHAAIRTFMTATRVAYPVDSSAVAFLWILVAPLFFALSLREARPFQLPRLYDVLRCGLFVGWLGASFLSAISVTSI